jgi:chromosome segregation ATPase
MSTLSVAQAETQLAAAQAENAKQKRENAKREIQRLRAEGATLTKELRPLAAQVREAQAERLKLHGLLLQARNQINFYAAPLDPLTFPSDEDIAEHGKQLTLWRNRQKELLAAHEDCVRREGVRAEAVTLQKRLEHLQYSINNLSAVAEGRRPGQLEGGGVFQNVEDFIGHTQ